MENGSVLRLLLGKIETTLKRLWMKAGKSVKIYYKGLQKSLMTQLCVVM